MTSLFDLSGRVALVTGANSGLGLAIAQAYAAHGAAVILCGVDGPGCLAAASDLQAQGHEALALPCDLGRREALEQMVDQSLAWRGRIDVLVCNAGVEGHVGPIGEASDAAWDSVMTVNLRSVLWLTRRVIPGMAERGGGSVILMSSIAGLRGNKAIGLYGLSKAAVAELARNLAVEWGPQQVRVNAISPGLIRTPFAQHALANADWVARRMSLTPLRRPGEPEEIAGVAVMLASAAGGFITGQNLVVDGGTTISDGN